MVLGGVLPDNPLVHVVVVLLSTGVIWIGSGWLESSAEQLSAHYGLPPVVQGSIVAAVAGVFDLGVGAVVGSAILNILVIPSVSGVLSEEDLDASRTLVYKEAQFYMVAVSALIITFALAVIYVPGGRPLTGELTPPLALIPLALYGLYLFIQWQDVSDYDAEEVSGIAVGRQWATLAGGLVLILVAVEQLVGSVESLAVTFGVPEFLAGVTVVAAATSLPDAIVSVRTAREGNAMTSLGNVLGSNTFDLLVVIPLGVLIAGTLNGETLTVDFATAAPMFGVLTLATVLLFAVLRTNLNLTDVEAYGMLAAYVLFVAWVVAESAGVTSVLRSG